jgi:hypothetical protein
LASGALVNIRVIIRNGPSNLRDAEKAKAAASILEQNDWLITLDESADVDGMNSRHVWRIFGKT